MEAATTRQPYRRQSQAPPSRPNGLQRLSKGFQGPVRGFLSEAGEIGQFTGRAFGEIPASLRYTSEMLRQAGILILGSAAVLIAMQFTFGMTCGSEGTYVLKGYGATSYAGVFTAICPLHEATPFMFGFMVGAKIGCGYVAELGSMRISDEIDAMESLGINPMRYLVATRLLANILVSLPIFLVGLCIFFCGEAFIVLIQLKQVSSAAFWGVHYSFISAGTVIDCYVKTLLIWVAIVASSLYYGFSAKGGPVGVGAATAKSMVVALSLTMVINEGMTYFFWGINPHLPVGG